MKPLVFLVPLFLVLRLGALLTGVELVYWDEELHRGTIAKELIEGPKVPLWDYRADHYDGGSLAVGFLAVPFFYLFGPSLFALKLVPILFSLGTLIVSFLFVKRFFGPRSAWTVGLLLALSPPVFTGLSLSAIGSHPESVFFSGLMLLFFYRFLYEKRGKALSLILFGLSSGLGISFAAMTLLTLLTLLVSWLLLDRRSLFGKQGMIFLGACAVGLTPWILYNWTHEFWGLRHLEGFLLGDTASFSLAERLTSVPVRLLTLTFSTFPLSFCFRPFLHIPGELLSLAYGLLVLFLLAPLYLQGIQGLHKTTLLPLLLYPLLLFLSYSIAGEASLPAPSPANFANFRYFSPLYYFLFLLLALVQHSAGIPRLFLCGLLGLGLIGQGSLLFQEPPGRALRSQGYSYFMLGEVWGKNRYAYPKRWGEFRALAERFGPRQRRLLYLGLSKHFWRFPQLTDWGVGADPAVAREAIHREIPPPYRLYFIEALGHALAPRTEKDLASGIALGRSLSTEEQPYFFYGLSADLAEPRSPEETEVHLKLWEKLRPPYAELFYFNLGWALYEYLGKERWRDESQRILDRLKGGERAWTCRALGANAGYTWVETNRLLSKTFSLVSGGLSPTERNDFFWGIGWGALTYYQNTEPGRVMERILELPPEIREPALQGFRAFERWYMLAASSS